MIMGGKHEVELARGTFVYMVSQFYRIIGLLE
jgi:hypothetical protein